MYSIRCFKSTWIFSFQRDFELPAVRLAKANLCSLFLKRLSYALLRCSFIKSVQNGSSNGGKVSLYTYSYHVPNLNRVTVLYIVSIPVDECGGSWD